MPIPDRVRYFPLDRGGFGGAGLDAPPVGCGYEEVVTHPDGSTSVTIVDPTLDAAAFDRAGSDASRPEAPDVDAVARRFAASRDFLFCHDARAWFMWDGAIWRRDRAGAIRRAIRETIGAMVRDEIGDDESRLEARRVDEPETQALTAEGRVDMRRIAGKQHADSQSFVATIEGSETLKARARAIRDQIATVVTDALSESVGRIATDPAAQLAAGLLLATWTIALIQAHRTFRQRQDAEAAKATFLAIVDQGTIGVKTAMAGTPYA